MIVATQKNEMQLLTHSRQDCFKVCRKRHEFAYELGIRPRLDSKALRMGSAYHAGLESFGKGGSVNDAVDAVRNKYGNCPEGFDIADWLFECETVVRLVCGYEWRWREAPLKNVATEQSFAIDLINPESGRKSPLFKLAGKIDGIVEEASGRLLVKESKLYGDDIGMESDLWKRMRFDHQVSLYVVAARRLGYQVEGVLFDLGRKPTIQPSAVPLLDELGCKIVNDASGNRVKTDRGMWRQTGDKEKGYTLLTRAMTADEWGEKLNNDIAERPDFYYMRHEIPRTDQDLAEFEAELWDIQKTLREAQLSGRWYRTANKNTCGFCPYFDLCSSGFDVSRDALPERFERVEDCHPELERIVPHVDSTK
jgi:hypothetical protein